MITMQLHNHWPHLRRADKRGQGIVMNHEWPDLSEIEAGIDQHIVKIRR
jgi:hypothetical protein